MRYTSLLGFAFLSSSISALPAKRADKSVGYIRLPVTRAPLAKKNGLAARQDTPPTAELNNLGYGYWVEAAVGTPAQSLKLLVDTGSSDIWVFSEQGAASCADCTDVYFDSAASSSFTTVPNLGPWGIHYGDGSSVDGYYAADIVGVGGVAVPQIIGVAANATDTTGLGFENGLMGLGLDQGESITRHGGKAYPGFITTLKSQGHIEVAAYSIYLNSKSRSDTATGEIIFGGYNSDQFDRDLVAFPMVQPAPDGRYRLTTAEPALSFSIDGTKKVAIDAVSSNYTVLFDTGASITGLPVEQFTKIAAGIGATQIRDTENYSVDCDLAKKSGSMNYEFTNAEGQSMLIEVPWNQLVSPSKSLPTGQCRFGIYPRTEKSADGVYVLGDTFLRSAYILFNYDDATISLAPALYDDQTHTGSKIEALRRK